MRHQQYAALVLFALIIASSLTSFGCYSCMSRLVNEDMDRALAITMQEQQSDVICQDTIHIFNSHLKIADLRGKARDQPCYYGPCHLFGLCLCGTNAIGIKLIHNYYV